MILLLRKITIVSTVLIMLAMSTGLSAYAADCTTNQTGALKSLVQYLVKYTASSGCNNKSLEECLTKLLRDSYTVKKSCPSQAPAPSATKKPVETSNPQPTNTPALTPAPTTIATPAPTATPKPTASATPKPTATATPAPTQTPSNTSTTLSSLEASMRDMINEERRKEGLTELKHSDALYYGARSHTLDMSQNQFFSHTSPTKGTFSERVKAAGLSSAAENIALYGSVAKAHAALMLSEGHRANIMGKSFTRVGIAIVFNEAKGGYYITQWFS